MNREFIQCVSLNPAMLVLRLEHKIKANTGNDISNWMYTCVIDKYHSPLLFDYFSIHLKISVCQVTFNRSQQQNSLLIRKHS